MDIADFTRRNFRHNLAFNILDSAVWQFGISFAAPTTILAVYVSHLTPNSIAVGLSLAMLDLGFFLPQLFTARFVTRLARAKPYVLAIGALQRFPYWLLALAVWVFRDAPSAARPSRSRFWRAMEFGPERDRATYVGLSRTLLGPFVGVSPILGGVLVGALGYSVMFATGLACTIASVGLLAFTVQDPRFAGPAQTVRPAQG
jgi:hypothetical protein